MSSSVSWGLMSASNRLPPQTPVSTSLSHPSPSMSSSSVSHMLSLSMSGGKSVCAWGWAAQRLVDIEPPVTVVIRVLD